MLEEKETINEQLTELLETYYDGSFTQMVCDYIHSSGMPPHEVEEMLAAMRLVVS